MASSSAVLLLALACCAAVALASPNFVPVVVGTPFGQPYPAPGAPWPGVLPAGQLAANSDTTTVGQCLSGDVLLHIETVRKSAKWMQIRHQDVEYPVKGKQGGLISCVQLVDLKGVNSGSAVIQKGGPGQREVAVRVRSERGHSVAWNVLVYGRQ